MGSTTSVILRVSTPEQGRVIIDTSDSYRYYSDLSSFSRVYCYPKRRRDWSAVSIDDFGTALVWRNRFEVHVDQIIGLATKIERLKMSRAA